MEPQQGDGIIPPQPAVSTGQTEPQQTLAATQAQPPSPRGKFKILKRIGVILITIMMCCGVLAAVNPLFALALMYPVFALQSMVNHANDAALEKKVADTPESQIVMTTQLKDADCVGQFGGEGFMDNSYPGIQLYAEKLNAGKGDSVMVCKTAKGTFVTKGTYTNGGETHLNEVYLDNPDGLDKIFEFGDTVSEFAEDTDGNVFLLRSLDLGPNVSRQPFVYDAGTHSFLKVANMPEVFSVCSRTNANQCMTWRTRDFPAPAVANYDSAAEASAYASAHTPEKKTAAQLACIDAFNKPSTRASGDLKNIKLVSDLGDEPVYSCVTDKSKKPFQFDIYMAHNVTAGGVLYLFDPTYAYFSSKGTSTSSRVIDYQLTYPGFTVYDYALDSIAYAVFQNLVAGQYKLGELTPDFDNNEAGWAGFTPRSSLKSFTKTQYKGVDIYTINAATRYKAFLLGKTYVLIRYDAYLNNAISEDLATKIAENIISSKPYVPVKNIVLKQASSAADFETVAREFLQADLVDAKEYYAKNKTYKGVCIDQNHSAVESMLMRQIIMANFGTQCNEETTTTMSFGAYIADTKTGMPIQSMTIDQNGYFTESASGAPSSAPIQAAATVPTTAAPKFGDIQVPGSNPPQYISINPHVDASVTQTEVNLIHGELKSGSVSSREDCVARVAGLYNSGDASKAYATAVADACVYYLEGGV